MPSTRSARATRRMRRCTRMRSRRRRSSDAPAWPVACWHAAALRAAPSPRLLHWMAPRRQPECVRHSPAAPRAKPRVRQRSSPPSSDTRIWASCGCSADRCRRRRPRAARAARFGRAARRTRRRGPRARRPARRGQSRARGFRSDRRDNRRRASAPRRARRCARARGPNGRDGIRRIDTSGAGSCNALRRIRAVPHGRA